jgi:hypothetical protein
MADRVGDEVILTDQGWGRERRIRLQGDLISGSSANLGQHIGDDGIVRGDELVEVLLVQEVEVAGLLYLHVHAHEGHYHALHRLRVVVQSHRLCHHRADYHDVITV